MPDTNRTRSPRRWIWPAAGAGLAVLFAATAFGVTAPRVLAFRGVGGGHGGHRFGAQLMRDPASAKQHVGAATEWILRGVSATDEQKQQARRITDRLIDDVAPVASKHHEHREAIARELARPQIDRQALERLRREEIALADEVSRKVLASVVDLAEVLTPEQRADILDFVHRFHAGGGMPSLE